MDNDGSEKTPLQFGISFEGTLLIIQDTEYSKNGFIHNLPGCLVLALGSELESFPLTRNQCHHPKLQEAESKQTHKRKINQFKQ